MVMSRTTNQRDRYDVTKPVSPKIKYNINCIAASLLSL